MAFNIGVMLHPQTKQPIALISADPEPLGPEQVLGILRMIKQFFPNLFDQVKLEIHKPVNGNNRLELPDDLSKEKGGG